MHITRLKASNVKRLKAVDVQFDPDDPAVTIKGKNAAGKSSILDAIWFALGGGNSFKGQEVIRDGEDRAEATVTVDGFEIQRTWTEKSTRLRVMDAEGREYSSPQSLLDSWAETFMFDPLEFVELHPSDQKAKLLELSGHGEELEDLEAKHDKVYQDRRDNNRDVRQLKSQIEAMDSVDPDLVDEEVPTTSKLVEELNEARDKQATKERYESKASELRTEAEAFREEAKRLIESAEDAEEKADEFENDAEVIEVPDIEQLQDRVEQADELREQVEAARKKASLREQYKEAKEKSDDMTKRLEEIEKEKQGIIENADLPEGVGFTGDTVTFQGRPLEQASMSEKLRVSMGIAMHMDPELKVLQLRDASLLDDDSQEEVRSLAKDMGFQVFLELVGTDGPATILIEDGEVQDSSG